MDRAEQARLVREQRAGFEYVRRLEIEEARRATFADRLAAFTRILSLSGWLPERDTRADDDLLTERWTRIRARYDAKRL